MIIGEVYLIEKEYKKFMKKCCKEHKVKEIGASSKIKQRQNHLKVIRCKKLDNRNLNYTNTTFTHLQKCGLCCRKFKDLLEYARKYKNLSLSYKILSEKLPQREEKTQEILQYLFQ